MTCLQNCRKKLSFATFYQVYSNSKRVTPPPLTKSVFLIEDYLSYQTPKFFLRPSGDLLRVKYIISVPAALQEDKFRIFVSRLFHSVVATRKKKSLKKLCLVLKLGMLLL